MKTIMFKFAIAAALLFSIAVFPDSSHAEGMVSTPHDLLVSPTRILFEGTDHTAEVTLLNQSQQPLAYRLSFVQLHMDESGEMLPDKSPSTDERSADRYVRFTPRRVLLQPGQAQKVRMLLRRDAAMADGEYRSHLQFAVIPQAVEAAAPTPGQQGLSIKLIPLYGISIPVIVRNGSLQSSVRLTNMTLRPSSRQNIPILSLGLERDGVRSTYGSIDVHWKAPGKAPVAVGTVKGVAVYAENARRRIAIPLSFPDRLTVSGGELTVRYTDTEQHGNGRILAEGVLSVP